jgi:hypothetical protein
LEDLANIEKAAEDKERRRRGLLAQLTAETGDCATDSDSDTDDEDAIEKVSGR